MFDIKDKKIKLRENIKAQSAIDLLITYSYAILIVTIIISVLFVFINLPRNLFPTECNFYGNLKCTGAMIVQQSNGITALSVLASDSIPGIINISSFNAKIENAKGSGSCAPAQTKEGQYTYCIAELNTQLSNNIVYNGTFNISANYCANIKGQCPSSSNYIIAGTLKIMPSTQNIISYPLIIYSNGGGTTQPAGIQMLPNGASATVYAIPNPGYTFSSWQCTGAGCYAGTENPISLTINNLITETATFTPT